jgi:hypothetical protein
MVRNKNLIILLLSIFLIVGPLGLYSFNNAMKVADRMVAPVSNKLKLVSCRLSRIYFIKGHYTERTSIGWEVSYKVNESFDEHVEVYVSFLGTIETTHPLDLAERIRIMTHK